MEVVVLLSVLVMITKINVEARSFDSEIEESHTKDGNDSEKAPKEKIFKLPTAIENGFSLTIRGTLELNQSRFTAELPALNGSESEYCRISYKLNERSLIIEASPPLTDDIEESTEPYYLVDSAEILPETVDFILMIEADEENKRFKLTFNANGAGEKTLFCGVNNFEDIDHIVIKEGVQKIKSLLFEFI